MGGATIVVPGPTMALEVLAEQLALETREAELSKPLDRSRVECFACGHRCPISPGFAGVCKVRFNRGGKLTRPRATSTPCSATPSRRSRSSTLFPAARAFSFGMLGCDLHCGYCQNWVTSQALRDPASTLGFHARATPSELVRLALRQGAAAHGQHLQRAADHRRVGGGGVPRGQGRRPGHRLRLQRQRHAGGAGIHPAVGGSVQGRSEELRRPPLSRTGRAASGRCWNPSAASTRWASGWRW